MSSHALKEMKRVMWTAEAINIRMPPAGQAWRLVERYRNAYLWHADVITRMEFHAYIGKLRKDLRHRAVMAK